MHHSGAWHGGPRAGLPSWAQRVCQALSFLPTQALPLLAPETLFSSFWASSFSEALPLSLPTFGR